MEDVMKVAKVTPKHLNGVGKRLPRQDGAPRSIRLPAKATRRTEGKSPGIALPHDVQSEPGQPRKHILPAPWNVWPKPDAGRRRDLLQAAHHADGAVSPLVATSGSGRTVPLETDTAYVSTG